MDMLRAAVKAGTPLGRKVEALLTKGNLVPDDIVIDIIAERYDRPDCAGGAVFDGFPRTIPQAHALDAMLSARGKKIEFHSNNLLGVSAKAYLDAIDFGVTVLHTASRPTSCNPRCARPKTRSERLSAI